MDENQTVKEEYKAIVIGVSSIHGSMSIKKKSNISEIFGYGEMPTRIKAMQKNIADAPILGVGINANIIGVISPVKTLSNLYIAISGLPICTSNIQCEISKDGTIGQAELKITITGDVEKEEVIIIPENGVVVLDNTGLEILFPLEVNYTQSDSWSWDTSAPQSSFDVFEKTIRENLELHTPEFILIAQSVNADFVQKLGVLAEEFFENRKPVLFLTETDLDETLSYEEAVSEKQVEFAKVDARFVSVVCMPKSNISVVGLCAGHITKANVNQSIGATNNFAIYDYQSPEGWNNAHSRALDESRFITLRTYAGLNNLFWTNGRTMANDKSDYRYIEVVRTVFKAIRLSYLAAQQYIYPNSNLTDKIKKNLNGMINPVPKEIEDFTIIQYEKDKSTYHIELFGIPIIRSIKIIIKIDIDEQNAVDENNK